MHLKIGTASTLMDSKILLLVNFTDLALWWDDLMFENVTRRIIFCIIVHTVDINFNCAAGAEVWLNRL